MFGCQVHLDGEIWAATLWVLRDMLMNSGATSAQVDQIIVNGLKMTPEQPNFLDARDAIIQAVDGSPLPQSAVCIAWEAFAEKGMGINAQNDNSNDPSAVDGFNLPPSCGGGGGPTLTCDQALMQPVNNGSVSWTGCSVDTAGAYTILASSAAGNAPSAQFTIGGNNGGGQPSQLAFSGQPSNGVVNLSLIGQPQVQLLNPGGVLTSSNASVLLELITPPTLQSPPVPPGGESRKPLNGKDSLLPDVAANGTPTEEWAVWLVPGSDGATVAAALGATYIGPVNVIPDVHLFRFDGASQLRSPGVVNALESSTSVVQYEQQVIVDTETRTLPSDPGIASQWHIKNTGQGGRTPGVDVNVEPAWDAGFTGQGVVVATVDNGVDYTNGDISPNYSPTLSFDFAGGDADPKPEATVGNWHGTAVAGLIGGAANNGTCGAGVAYDALLAAIRGGGLPINDSQAAAMLGFQQQAIDIYNNSWGPSDSGTSLGAIGALTLASIQNGVATGRGGLGNIYVWAGGNGRTAGDNVSFDAYASLRQVIAVAAVEGSGIFSSYSEPGTPLLISTPGGTIGGDIYTTDIVGGGGADPGDCDGGFNGTSAASPIAAGAIAVILEANPNLTWRDVQHILVRTATKVNPGEADWSLNGAGRNINHNYGFGLLNTAAAVTLAQGWQNVGPELSATSNLQAVNAAIPDNNATGVTRQVVMNGPLKVEHVELVFNAQHTFRGDIEVTLTSPSGTVSKMAVKRGNDSGDNFTNWKFTSTRHWDEMMQGTWTVNVKDSAALVSGTWTNFTLNFFGTEENDPGGATLVCDQNPKAAVNGTASFTGCKVSGAGEDYTIRATSAGLTQSTSSTFDITDPNLDATCDGSIDTTDSLAVMRQIAGFNSGIVVAQPCTGDADLDQDLGIADAVLIRRKVAGFF